MQKKIVDLRSDTVTKPSPAMWNTLRNLDNTALGDDVMREDPTINELESKAAKLVGKEAALFVTSGSQGNLISILANTNPGEQIFVEEHAHIFKYEVGGVARIGGLMPRLFTSNYGLFDPQTLTPFISDSSDVHESRTSLLCLENTHNSHGGTILPPSLLNECRVFADQHDLKIHLDGARIFNAAVGLGIPVTDFTKYVDSVQFCLSKGLSCPVGSIIAGSQEFIEKALKIRKLLGGGWRQAGILASMGLVALESPWIDRLAEDHALAKILWNELNSLELPLRIREPETNMLMLELDPKIELGMGEFIEKLDAVGILAFEDRNRIRLVTHYGLTELDMHYTAQQIAQVFLSLKG
ncbi:MAG: threonine aldolase family protein [Promethearchaeota archaeon]